MDSASPQLGTNLVLHSVQLCGTHLFGFFPEVLGLLVVGGPRWIFVFVLLGVLEVGFGCGFVFVVVLGFFYKLMEFSYDKKFCTGTFLEKRTSMRYLSSWSVVSYAVWIFAALSCIKQRTVLD